MTINNDTNNLGAVDKKEHELAFTIGPKGKEVLHAWLEDITDPPGPITVRPSDGATHVWTIARYTEAEEKASQGKEESILVK